MQHPCILCCDLSKIFYIYLPMVVLARGVQLLDSGNVRVAQNVVALTFVTSFCHIKVYRSVER